MPSKPLRPCGYPGCPNLSAGPYCEKHKAKVNREYDKYDRSPDKAKRYGAGWRKVRAAYYAAHPFCEECFKEGHMVMAAEVHHLIPVKQGGSDDISNLRSLCRSCHNKMHTERGER